MKNTRKKTTDGPRQIMSTVPAWNIEDGRERKKHKSKGLVSRERSRNRELISVIEMRFNANAVNSLLLEFRSVLSTRRYQVVEKCFQFWYDNVPEIVHGSYGSQRPCCNTIVEIEESYRPMYQLHIFSPWLSYEMCCTNEVDLT